MQNESTAESSLKTFLHYFQTALSDCFEDHTYLQLIVSAQGLNEVVVVLLYHVYILLYTFIIIVACILFEI